MRIHVEVTQNDIDNGCVGDSGGEYGGCMVYRAFNRATEGAFDGRFRVFYDEISIKANDGLHLISVRHPARHQIQMFDTKRYATPSPFAFYVDIPDEALS